MEEEDNRDFFAAALENEYDLEDEFVAEMLAMEMPEEID